MKIVLEDFAYYGGHHQHFRRPHGFRQNIEEEGQSEGPDEGQSEEMGTSAEDSKY